MAGSSAKYSPRPSACPARRDGSSPFDMMPATLAPGVPWNTSPSPRPRATCSPRHKMPLNAIQCHSTQERSAKMCVDDVAGPGPPMCGTAPPHALVRGGAVRREEPLVLPPARLPSLHGARG